MTTHDFFSFLTETIDRKKSLLCVGLDPQGISEEDKNPGETIVRLNKRIIDETAPYAACFKPNIAFYEVYGQEGLAALEETIAYIPDDTPVLIDAKRSDIGNTARAYADAIFKKLGADAVTLNPYLGKESVTPFLAYKDKGLFLLCRTSNPGSAAIQELLVTGNSGGIKEPTPLYIQMAGEVCSWSDSIGLVVAGNDPAALSSIRELLPHVWILAPGIGAQGGNAEEAIAAGLREDNRGLLINVSRSIAQAPSPGEKALYYRDMIEAAKEKREKPGTMISVSLEKSRKKKLVRDIIHQGCFKTGSFTLKSGLVSPFYIDLRLIISNAQLLRDVAQAYAGILKKIQFDRIAGIPFAGMPIATAIALHLSSPMIFPRLTKKAHGSGNTIEGTYNPGEKVVLIDDLITTGKSKFEALDVLEAGELTVKDLVVLIERGTRGRKELNERGVQLHSCFNVAEFITLAKETGAISEKEEKEIVDFLNTQ